MGRVIEYRKHIILSEVLRRGFFLIVGDPSKQVYCAMTHGQRTFCFPIKDGKICREHDSAILQSNDLVEVIHILDTAEHGVDIKEGDELDDPRFWADPE